MRQIGWAGVLTVMLGMAAPLVMAGEVIYLVPGQGIKGGLQIGDAGQIKDRWNEVRLPKQKESKELTYRTNTARQVVAIQCSKPECVTDQGIRVGMSETNVLRRYGAPRKETPTNTGIYYEYLGIGFEVVNATVVTIYIYARTPR
jgi:hypothetical protein